MRIKFLLIFLISSILNAHQTTFFIVRHGKTHWNEQGRVQGSQDIPLSEEGIKQAHQTAQKIKALSPKDKIAGVYSSDLSRAYETGKIISRACQVPFIDKVVDLRERATGIAEGKKIETYHTLFKYECELERLKKKYAHLKNQHSFLKEKWDAPLIPGAKESIGNLAPRISKTLKNISKNHPNESVVIVTHQFITRCFLASLKNCPIDEVEKISNCQLIKVVCTLQENDNLALFSLSKDPLNS